ncbi:hypothetical protein FQA39_LY07304 [Lamprigera yunnana]|nr:hypothetical protein FQA39_LY07304 [Lamprigera yunnana]
MGTSSKAITFLPFVLSMGAIAQKSYPSYNEINVLEQSGPFKTHYLWKQVDFAYDTEFDRIKAATAGEFLQENNLPLGIEVFKNRIFVSFPKWKDGTPCTLAVIPRVSSKTSPLFVPYPNWRWHNSGTCDGLVSVYRMQVDRCNRLWVLDSGQINVSVKPTQVCPPKIVIFDLNNDNPILKYELPDEFIKQDSLYSNIAVDMNLQEPNYCENAYAYIADVWRFGIVVFSLREKRGWRITDHLFYPDPMAAAFNLHGLKFEWTDGVFSFALGPQIRNTDDRYLYFHPMASYREFYMRTSILKNESAWSSTKRTIRILGESRGLRGQASSSAMDDNGIMFVNLVSRDSVACWDSRKPYKRANIGVIAESNTTLVFPNDLRLDKEPRQSVWVLSNKLPFFLYSNLDATDYNFRIMSAYVDEAIAGTICDPSVSSDEYD